MIRPLLPLLVLFAVPGRLGAQDVDPADPDAGSPDEPIYETVIAAPRPPAASLPEGRATSEVTRRELEERLPRSVPDALRPLPGVFVQQTAHGQGSAYLRGLTGQQTLLLFDGVRLNTSTWRQGPNQYAFTLDSQVLESLEVLRGGASTRFGSDALGGVILARPVEPSLRAAEDDATVTAEPHLKARVASADDERGGRIESNLTLGAPLAFFGGIGGRRVGLLESGGPVSGVVGRTRALVPRFADDGRTQLGTGFDELTADGRVLYAIDHDTRLTVAAYTYQQFDAPRTDQCPAAYAPWNECLRYDEQLRTLAYAALATEPRLAALAALRATLSYQNQLERRTRDRPSSAVRNIGRDTVDTFGASLTGRSRSLAPAPWISTGLDYGVDTYHDRVASASWVTFTDVGTTTALDRGQYVDGSRYTTGGLFLDGTAELFERFTLRTGGRVSWIVVRAPEVPEADVTTVAREWTPLVGHVGLEVALPAGLGVVTNVDRSFRAPNLDDLTSRQQTGPGFQFENPALRPETADTFEVGLTRAGALRAELWLFRTLIHDAVVKRPMSTADCPPDSTECRSSWTRLMLVNAAADSEVRGLEALLGATGPHGLGSRLSLSWTWGEGPDVAAPADPSSSDAGRVPLSRIPPLNGTAELSWTGAHGFFAAAGLRFAAAQTRLALADYSDARIPTGGTPGFAVLELRAGYRTDDLLVSVVFENVGDAAYRDHGSSINGPARGVVLFVDLGPWWRGM